MAINHYKSSKKGLFAFLAMLFGTALMVLLVVTFNKPVKKKEQKVKKEIRYMKMKKTAQKVKKPKPKPKPKPKKALPKAPLPNLGALLGGIEMNIPEFATGDIAGSDKDILGDIAADAAMSEGTVDVKPKAISRSQMQYPKSAMKKHIKGFVILNILIDKQGSVEVAKVLESNPPGVFDQVALSGIRSWRFSPAKYKGKPVKTWAKQKVRFDFN